MGVNALTIHIPTNRPEEALKRITAAWSRISKPAGLLGFASGAMVKSLEELAEGVRKSLSGLPALFAASEGVFTNEGELPEGQDGIACLLLGGSKLGLELEQNALESVRISRSERHTAPRMLLIANQPGSSDGPLKTAEFVSGWFGAVTTGEAPLWGVQTDGRVRRCMSALVEFPSLEPPLLVASPCCRLISKPLRVSSVEGTTVFELDGVPALVALGQASAKLVDRSWIVIGITDDPECVPSTNDGTPNLLFRPMRGIDPARGAIVLTENMAEGSLLAFAVRDDRASRRSLEEALRNMKPRLCGGAPRFGLYFDGLGRGRSLYGTANVDLGLVRQVLGDFPVLGMKSSFELRGDVASPVKQSLTGQLALFRNPS